MLALTFTIPSNSLPENNGSMNSLSNNIQKKFVLDRHEVFPQAPGNYSDVAVSLERHTPLTSWWYKRGSNQTLYTDTDISCCYIHVCEESCMRKVKMYRKQDK